MGDRLFMNEKFNTPALKNNDFRDQKSFRKHKKPSDKRT